MLYIIPLYTTVSPEHGDESHIHSYIHSTTTPSTTAVYHCKYLVATMRNYDDSTAIYRKEGLTWCKSLMCKRDLIFKPLVLVVVVVVVPLI